MDALYVILGLALIVSPALFTLLYINDKKKQNRKLWLAGASYVFFVLVHFGISSDDEERIEAAEAVTYDFMSCISYIETNDDMSECFDNLADDAESYSNEYQE